MKRTEDSGHGSVKMAIVSKMYCSTSEAVLTVRRRPHVVNGGGFVVTENDDDQNSKVVFRVDGCGVLGTSEELVVRDGDADALLLIRRKSRGCLEAISIHRKWKGYSLLDYQLGSGQKLVFTMTEPHSCMSRSNCGIRISIEPARDRGLEIKGYFPDRNCSLVDSSGKELAQVCAGKDGVGLGCDTVQCKDVYHVVVRAGVDQAFVCGVIAVLDHIHGESTSC